jgi:hypothetical protein
MIQKGETSAELVEVLGEDGAADLDDGELLRRDRGEELEVLLALAFAADAADGLGDHLTGAVARERGGDRLCGRQLPPGRTVVITIVVEAGGVEASDLVRSSSSNPAAGSAGCSTGTGPQATEGADSIVSEGLLSGQSTPC